MLYIPELGIDVLKLACKKYKNNEIKVPFENKSKNTYSIDIEFLDQPSENNNNKYVEVTAFI